MRRSSRSRAAGRAATCHHQPPALDTISSPAPPRCTPTLSLAVELVSGGDDCSTHELLVAHHDEGDGLPQPVAVELAPVADLLAHVAIPDVREALQPPPPSAPHAPRRHPTSALPCFLRSGHALTVYSDGAIEWVWVPVSSMLKYERSTLKGLRTSRIAR
jgi:hypothetical protein